MVPDGTRQYSFQGDIFVYEVGQFVGLTSRCWHGIGTVLLGHLLGHLLGCR